MGLSVAGMLRLCNVCGNALAGQQRCYCGLACKMRAWWQSHERISPPPKPKPVKALKIYPACLQCGHPCQGNNKTCSIKCQGERLSTLLRGKKYRPAKVHQQVCERCSRVFSLTQRWKHKVMCRFCVRAVDPNRQHGKSERRAKKAGVPYVYGIKPESVFARDGWRCQLCRCKTPQLLRGSTHMRAPELDHIIPISAGGGHTWDNVQCACRKCNMRKGARPLGQLRLAV